MLSTLRRIPRIASVTRASSTIPQFTVGTANGFLPREPPLTELPAPFEKLESLLQGMPIKTRKGEEGMLLKQNFGETLMKELPDHTKDVEGITDTALLTALFRDYTFAASAYLLEPCGKCVCSTYSTVTIVCGCYMWIYIASFMLYRCPVQKGWYLRSW